MNRVIPKVAPNEISSSSEGRSPVSTISVSNSELTLARVASTQGFLLQTGRGMGAAGFEPATFRV